MKILFSDAAKPYILEKPHQNCGPQSDFGTSQTIETLANSSFVGSHVIGQIRNPDSFARRLETYPASGAARNVSWNGCLALSDTDIIMPQEIAERIAPSVEDCLKNYLAAGHPTEGVSIWASYRQGTQGGHFNFGSPFAALPHFDRAAKALLTPEGVAKNIVYTMSSCQQTAWYNQTFTLDRKSLEDASHESVFENATHQLSVQINQASRLPAKDFDIVCSDGLSVHAQIIGPKPEERFFLQLLFTTANPGDAYSREVQENPALAAETRRLGLT